MGSRIHACAIWDSSRRLQSTDILLWIYHSILYAKECYLRTPITKSYSEVVRDAVDRCIYIATYGRKDGITFGSFDNDIFYQPTTNSTATVTTPIVYDDQCAYEIDFGIPSNETWKKIKQPTLTWKPYLHRLTKSLSSMKIDGRYKGDSIFCLYLLDLIQNNQRSRALRRLYINLHW